MKKIFLIQNKIKESIALLILSLCCLTAAAQMAPGNIVINTVGNGSSTLSNAGWRINARVINQANGNTLNNFSGPVNPASGKKLSNSGVASSEGALTLSLNGHYLTMVGYDADSSQSSVASTSSSSVSRVVARVDSAGNFNVTTYSGSAYTANNFRSSCTEDGSSFYIGGAGTSSTNAGLKLISFGSTSTTNINTTVGGSNANLRWSGIYAYYDTSFATLYKNIFVTTGSGTAGLFQIGSGLPTSSTTTTTQITTTASPYGFVFLDASTTESGLDLLYVANDGTNIQKFYKNSGTWIAAGTFSVTGVRGITGYITAEGRVKLIVTRGNTSSLAGKLVYAWDNAAYNATINLQNNSNNNLSLSNYNVLFSSDSTLLAQRGVAFTPTSFATHPSNAFACVNGGATMSVAMYTPSNSDSAVYEYYWQRSLDNGNTWDHVTTTLDYGIYSNTRTPNLTFSDLQIPCSGYVYRCLVRYMSQFWLYSNNATLYVNSNPNAPAVISGSTPVCSGSSQTYSVNSVPSTTYTWTLPGTWSGTSNTNSINTTVGTSSGTISVTATQNGCTSPATTKSVTVNTTPSAPSAISGNSPVCSGSSQTYSVNNVASTTYNWTLPGGWSGSSSANSITTIVGSSGGTISVTASQNGCTSSSSALPVTVNTTPSAPSGLSGNTLVCPASTHFYSVTNVANTTYDWTLPSGWSGTSSSNSITAVTGSSGGTILVTATLNGCTGMASSLSVGMNQNSSSTVSATSCGTYSLNSTSYPFSGTYTQTIPNANGCDSLITLNLVVVTSPVADAGSDIHVCTNSSAQLDASDPSNDQAGLWYLFLGSGSISNPSNPNTTITNLSQSSTYMWILNDALNVCPPDTDFVFVETVPRPSSLSSSNIASTSADVQWSSAVDPDSFLIRYQKNCTGTYYYAWVGGTLRQATLTGLDACTNYCFRVRAQCTGSATPQYSSTTGTFTTGAGASCVAVTNVTIANTSACTYNVSWSNCVTADSFRVRYKLSSASVWSFSPWSTAYSANITMGPGSWMVRVQSKCGTTIYTTSTTNYSIGSCRIAGENASAFSEMVLFPNPTATQSLLNFSSTIDANYTIAISDLSGRVLRTNEGSAVTGENTAQISVDGLSKGVYIVALSLNGETRQVKLNVQ